MLEELLSQDESKILEFKENAESLSRIIKTIIAFANTAGGTIVIGIKDKTKEIVGVKNILNDEERLSSAISDSIYPLLIPTFQFHTWRGKDILILSVSHSFGPYYLKAQSIESGTYVRFGSTNRIASSQIIEEIKRLRENRFYDEQYNLSTSLEDLDFNLAKDLFAQVDRTFSEQTAKSLSLIVPYHTKHYPSNGGILLFAKDFKKIFPDPLIRLGKFAGLDKTEIIDQKDLMVPISIAVHEILEFIQRHTSIAAEIISVKRKDIPQYPIVALREAVVNALLHTDYSIKGSYIQIAIFLDRIEIINPGSLPFGLSLQSALSGISQLRNHVIGRVFRELNLIEQWGSGLNRIIQNNLQQGIVAPKFEELDNFFKVTLYHKKISATIADKWEIIIIKYLEINIEVNAKKAQVLWKVTPRTTSKRLKLMIERGLLVEISTSPFDPQKVFRLKK